MVQPLSSEEVILAQEQGVTKRGTGLAKEIKGEFDVGETEGTLILTNVRLMFVVSDQKEEDLPEPMMFNPWGKVALYYSDVEDLKSIADAAGNLFVPLSSISSVTGHKGEITRPRLEVSWSGAERANAALFTQELTGRRRRNLSDWAAVIQRLKAGTQKLVPLPGAPGIETAEGKIVRILSDMQQKGVFGVMEELKEKFGLELDPDEVQSQCDRLSSDGILERTADPSGDVFYRKYSPLGEDDLSG